MSIYEIEYLPNLMELKASHPDRHLVTMLHSSGVGTSSHFDTFTCFEVKPSVKARAVIRDKERAKEMAEVKTLKYR